VQDRGILGLVRFIEAGLEVWKKGRKEGRGDWHFRKLSLAKSSGKDGFYGNILAATKVLAQALPHVYSSNYA